MRQFLLGTLSLLLLVSPLASQQFEGTLTVRVGGPGGTGSILSRMTTKGDKVLTVITLPGSPPKELRMITDNRAGTLTTLAPFPPGSVLPAGLSTAKGVIAVRTIPAPPPSPAGAAAKSEVRKLGTSQTIAATPCDDYEVTSANGQVVLMCLASSLGAMVPGTFGGGGQSGQAAPWATALGKKPLMPLKIWQPDGTIVLQVVTVKRETISPRVFDIPAGYVDLQTVAQHRAETPKP